MDASLSVSSNMEQFKKILSNAKNVFILTGAGISAESGIPTFRGSGGLWRKYQAQSLANPAAFKKSPSLVWEFYHYRRELVQTKNPNAAHYAVASLQKKFKERKLNTHLVTQNIDELHKRAGSINIIELHGSLFKTKCLSCKVLESNYESPICEALRGKGAPDSDATDSDIPVEELPHCKDLSCKGLLRPAVVWFNEALDSDVLAATQSALDACDLCLIIGTSSVVYPAASFAPYLAKKGIPVAEFNLEATACTNSFSFHFQGPCTETVVQALEDYI